MTEQAYQRPPQALARLGGALYLVLIVVGLFGEVFVRGRLIVANDAMATAANIQAHEMLWRASIATELFAFLCVTVLMLVWVVLFTPVSRNLTILAIFFALNAHTLGLMSVLDLFAGLFPLGSAPYLRAFTPEQLAALTRIAIRQHGHAYSLSLLCSGCFFLLAGPMIYRSGYLPRIVGVLYTIAGVGYIGHTFVLVLAPALADTVFLFVAAPILIGEATLSLWLLIKGVDVEGWNRRQLHPRT